jgi:hypothetical protein
MTSSMTIHVMSYSFYFFKANGAALYTPCVFNGKSSWHYSYKLHFYSQNSPENCTLLVAAFNVIMLSVKYVNLLSTKHKVKVKLSLCLIKYHAMKTHPVLN